MTDSSKHTCIDDLIYLYISGTIDKSSLQELEDWAMLSEDNLSYVRGKLEVWFSTGLLKESDTFGADWETSYKRLESRLFDETSESVIPISVLRKKYVWVAMVAALVLLLFLPLAGYWYGIGSRHKAASGICMETMSGARTKVNLPDGTQVWLNADSRLTYASDYGMKERRVRVEGEALFDVIKDEEHPFIIHSKELDLKVLGTRFTFSNYKDDDRVKVDLIRGKVFLTDNITSRKMYLDPNERMILDKATGDMAKKRIDATYSSEWIKGRLFFDEQPLSEIAKTLERNYGVKIRVSNSLKTESFYGLFDMKKNTIDDILRAISSTRQMKYKYNYDDNEYILY